MRWGVWIVWEYVVGLKYVLESDYILGDELV